MLFPLESLAPFVGVAFLVVFALYCLCQAVREGSWRVSLRRLGLTCMLVLSALAFRGARLAGEKIGGGTNGTDRAGVVLRVPARASAAEPDDAIGDDALVDAPRIEAIAVTDAGVDLVLHRPVADSARAAAVTVAGSSQYAPGGWEALLDAAFPAGDAEVAVAVPAATLARHGISSPGFFAFAAAGDSDGDGLADWFELLNSRTRADSPDSDRDGLSDADELARGTDPTLRDTDGDGLDDGDEVGSVEVGAALPRSALTSTRVEAVNGLYTVSLPFTMNFGGFASSTLVMSGKGVAAFPVDGAGAAFAPGGANLDLSAPVFPEGIAAAVAVYWDDLLPPLPGGTYFDGVSHGTEVVDGVTYFTLMFRNFRRAGAVPPPAGAPTLVARILLSSAEPSTVHVVYDYRDPSFDGSSATIGAQGPGRRATFPVSFNQSWMPSHPVVAYRFGAGTDPLRADTDGDGLADGMELELGLDPLESDTDGDGMPDGWERRYDLDPSDPSDAAGDADRDGVSNLDEYRHGSSPRALDTDEDGVSDAAEIAQGTDPADGGDTLPVRWVSVTGDLGAGVTRAVRETVAIPAGTAAYVGVFVHSDEYPLWTGEQSPYNDVLSWFVAAAGQPTVSGGVLVNEEDVSWDGAVAQGWSVGGFEPVAHMGGAVYRAGAGDLEVAVELTATNVRDGNLPSSVVVGVFPLQLVQMNMPRGTGIGGTTDGGIPYRRAFIPQGGTAYITAQPAAPSLAAWFKGLPAWIDVAWSFALVTERPDHRFDGKDDRSLPEIVLRGSSDYFITAELRNEIVGGACTLSAQVGDSARADYPFRIRGKNPLDADARAYIDAHVDEEFRPYAWMIARHESRVGARLYNQFNAPDDRMKELPNWGTPHGWGIAQIDKRRNGDSTAEVYDWHENVMSMNRALCDKRERYLAILRMYRAAYQNDPEAQWSEPDDVTTNVCGVTISARQWTIMTLYNGAGGTAEFPRGFSFPTDAHTPIHFNKDTHRWELYNNSNDYVPTLYRGLNVEGRE